MIEDKKLTEHFSLFDLTHTEHAQFQEKNRQVNETQIEKLTEVAKLLESVEDLLGVRVTPTSGYRCPDLNAAVGSTERSQHLRCEAADFIPIGFSVEEAFRIIWKAVHESKVKVGQLIHETEIIDGKEAIWIHISLGKPFREGSRCNQIMKIQHKINVLLAFYPEA